VHAFEPQRLIFQQLCGNVALNGLVNVHTYNVGLDEMAGRLSLQHGGTSLRASARLDVTSHFQGDVRMVLRPERVDACPLDSFADILVDVGLVKIDVAGLELRVLRGAIEMLRRNDLPKLIVQCWAADWYRPDKEQLLRFLADLGYRVIPITGYEDVLLAEKR
jgi:FkbM family methyltransferase